MIDKTFQISEQELTYEDRKELKSQNFLFIGGTILLSFVGLMLFFLVFQTWPLRLGVAVVFLSLITLFASSMYSNFSDLKHGKKEIKSGKIWDLYEVFETELKKRPNDYIGKRSFHFKMGDVDHRFYNYSFDPSNKTEAETRDEKTEKYRAGQLVEMHYTRSGYLLREKTLEQARRTSNHPEAGQYINQKVRSKRRISQYFPRKWSEKEKGSFFYLVTNGMLFSVDETTFDKVAVNMPAKVESELSAGSDFRLSVMIEHGEWTAIQKANV